MKKITSLFACFAIYIFSFSQGTWTPKTNFGGVARQGATGFSIGTKGYIGTGYDGTVFKQDFWEYDAATNVWTQKADFGGGARIGATGFSIGTKGYVGTGVSSAPASTYFNDLWEYDPSNNTWSQKASFAGSGRSRAVGFSIGSFGYIATGSQPSSPFNDLWQYNPSSDSWIAKANFGGTGRSGAVAFSTGGYGYVATGGSSGGVYYKDVYQYNPSSDSWTQKADFGGVARRGAIAFAFNGKGYIGIGNNGSDKQDFWQYNPVNDTWTQKLIFGGSARQDAVGFSDGQAGYICTGYDGTNKKDLWQYAPCGYSPAVPICLVTVDSLSQYNNIIWDKTASTNTDSFIVYREITTNNYQRIGAQPYSALSLFVDTVRTKYAPNTGDPKAGTYRYKLQVRDTCGNYSPLSPYHNTIYMTNNSGNFSWVQLYTIEGSPNPVNSYILMRDDFNNGTWNAVNSVAGTQQNVNDPAYASWVATANWRIKTQWNISCTPTIIKNPEPMATTINNSKSNTYKISNPTSASEISLANSMNIFPNPSTGQFWIQSSEFRINSFEVFNVLGKIIYSEIVNGFSFNAHYELQNGIYIAHIKTENGIVVKKIIVAD